MKRLYTILFFILIGGLLLHPINAGDFFHHLNAGKYIALHYSLPYTDDLSFTAYGRPWVADAWGTDLILYLVYRSTGPTGISILFALIGTATIAFLYKTLRKLQIPWGHSIIASALAASLMSLRFPSRPEVMGPFLISMLLYGCAAGVQPFIFPLFFLAWSILYGPSSIAGLAIFAWYICANKMFSKQWILAFLLSFVASLCNGYGMRSLLYVIQVPAMAPHVGEWLPITATMNMAIPDLVIAYQYIFAVYILFTVTVALLLILAVFRYRAFTLKHLFITALAIGVILPFVSVRFMSFAPILSVPFLAKLSTHMSARWQKIIAILAILFTIMVIGVRFRQFSYGVGIQPDPFEPTLMAFLKTHHVRGNILSNQEIGAWLSWELPDSKVFVDTRDDLYQPTQIFPDLAAAANNQLSIGELTDRYHVDIVVFTPSLEPMYRPLLYDNGWKLIYLGDFYGILVRSDKTNQIAILHLDPYRDPPTKDGEELAGISVLQTLLSTNPQSLENNMRLVQLYLATNQPQQAEKILSSIVFPYTISPLNNAQLTLTKARVHIAVGSCNAAAAEISRIQTWTAHPFLFFPTTPAPLTIDEELGDYEVRCTKDVTKARMYYTQLLDHASPLVAHRIQQKLNSLR